MKLISGSSNPNFAKSLAEELAIELIDVDINKFANDEKRIWIKDKVRGESIILVQSFSHPVDEHIIETLLLSDALERLGARHINIVIPWMGYSLQDKVFRDGEPISAKVVADLISNAYAKRVFILDVHNTSVPGFFSLPTHHLSAIDLFANYVKENYDLKDSIVASPDFGGLKKARAFANKLKLDLVNIDKHRDLSSGKVTAVDIQGGEVRGKNVLFFDDVIVSGGTVIEAARIMKERGAKDVCFFSTHGLFVKNSIKKLEESQVDKIIITNSIYHENLNGKIKVLDATPLFAEELREWL
ncbi:MAG: ribose-phosphate pyrophosphokinase [Patescibacteria group bacterium]